MADVNTTAIAERETQRAQTPQQQPAAPPAAGKPSGGWFRQYKQDQGKYTRTGTFLGGLILSLWGGYFLYERLQRYEGDQWWQLAIVYGIPAVVAAALSAVAWVFSYSYRTSCDFMIATEGEMKKVSWSSRREVIGSTKVVIVLMIILAIILFAADVLFQWVFSSIGVLKTL